MTILIKKSLKYKLINYFNKGGYILDFGNEKFDAFTKQAVGKPIQTWASEELGIPQSKGKSFNHFINTSNDQDIYLLVKALVEYMHSFDYADYNPNSDYEIEHADKLLEEIEANISFNPLEQSKNDLISHFNDEYLTYKIDELNQLQQNDSPEAIGKAKELVESTFKFILNREGIEYSSNDDVMSLRKKCFKYLNLDSKENEFTSNNKDVKAVLSGLTQIVKGMNGLRNNYGSGHGVDQDFNILPPRYSELAVNSSITICIFTWETYKHKSGKL